MRINAVTQSLQAEFRKVENAKKVDKSAITGKTIPIDRSDISAGAQRLSATKASIEVISASFSQQDDIRTEKISEVQEKIKNGYYDSPEFLDKLAIKLLAEFGIKAPPQ
ncbi:MAG: flagellar biosynthesis anti-sigma factor FlgM [Chitinispirillaceae bacterium]|nr:flagellar biosynthesis anti-sigma factor FlgM [Chitinispirillaceae bacterium]